MTDKSIKKIDLDPITIQVIRNALISAANEMTETLIRTSFNPVLYEILDFSAGLYNDKAELIAEGKGAVMFLGTTSAGIKKVIEHVGIKNVDEGDAFVSCYSYYAGTHHPDVLIFKPIFYEHQIIGYSATKAHWTDTGAWVPFGSMITDMFQEGLILPATKLIKKGELNKDIVNIIKFNTRLPDTTIGDMTAQLAACETGEKRILALVKRYGKENLEKAVNAILDHDEFIMRKAITEIPDGEYYAEGGMDNNGQDDIPLKLCITIKVKGDEIVFDTTGSPKMQPSSTNTPYATTVAMCRLTTKTIFDPHTRSSDGSWRPLSVIAPEGSIFNAQPPAATRSFHNAAIAIGEAIFKAFAEAIPEKVVAASGGDVCVGFGFFGRNQKTGKYFAAVTGNSPVGQGASYDHDGGDATIHFAMSGAEAVPVEVCEAKYPYLVEKWALRDDSGGPGKYRGGLGVEKWIKARASGTIGGMLERTKFPPWGLYGGKPGKPNLGILYVGQDKERIWGKLTNLPLQEDERARILTGGGGGWGNPLERDPEVLLDDLIKGYISIQSARNDYGVVIKEEADDYYLDIEATELLRQKSIA